MESCFYKGLVRHRHFSSRKHEFQYRLFYVFLDLDELDDVLGKLPLWSSKHPAAAWFRRADYLGDKDISLKEAVCQRVEEVTGSRPSGPVRVLTHLRYFGFIFNPVSFYYCYNETDTKVESIIAEITNTPWNERYSYVLSSTQSLSSSNFLRFQMNKDFHVSPFMPMDIQYDWRFGAPGKQLNIHMINNRDGNNIFDATLRLNRKPMTKWSSTVILLSYPFMTLKVIIGIYWQALRLYMKNFPFFSHPKCKSRTNQEASIR